MSDYESLYESALKALEDATKYKRDLIDPRDRGFFTLGQALVYAILANAESHGSGIAPDDAEPWMQRRTPAA